MLSEGKPPLMPRASPSPRKVEHPRGGLQAELEALRQRGLATMLNKHFTETAARLAVEKAAADAALADLEERKKATSEFKASGDTDLSPLDSLYLSVHKWRAECRRKEKETLLLYQRYVHKFGATGHIQVPLLPSTPHGHKSSYPPSSVMHLLQSPDSTDSPAPCAPPPAISPPAPPSVQVPSMAAAIEATLEQYMKEGGISMPSVELLGLTETFHTSHTKEEAEFRNYYRRQLEERGVDAKATITGMGVTPDAYTGPGFAVEPGHVAMRMHSTNLNSSFLRTICEDGDDDQDMGPLILHDNDCDSIMSGITFNSAMTREILDDCERTVVTFLKDEQEAIRKIMEEEDAMTAAESMPSEVGTLTAQMAEQAESMAKQMQEILDTFQTTSAAEKEDSVEAVSVAKEARPYKTANPNENWMAYYDDYYQREYFHELNSNRTQWDAPDAESVVSGRSPSPFLSHSEVMPESERSSASRRLAYRRKQRRRRRRKIVAAIATAVATTVAGVYYVRHHPDARLTQMHIVKIAMPVAEMVVDTNKVDAAIAKIQDTVDRFTGQAQVLLEQEMKARAEAELALKMAREEAARKAKAEASRKAKELAERKAQLEAERKEKVEADRRAREAERLARLEREEAQRLARELLEREEAQHIAREALRLRVGGNVPLAYYIEDLGLLTKNF